MKELEELKKAEALLTEVFVNVGNAHRAMGDKHQWTAFVEIAGDKNSTYKLIEKVRFGLHETFGCEYRDERAQ